MSIEKRDAMAKKRFIHSWYVWPPIFSDRGLYLAKLIIWTIRLCSHFHSEKEVVDERFRTEALNKANTFATFTYGKTVMTIAIVQNYFQLFSHARQSFS